MGQKVNTNGLRLGIIRNWESRWIAKNNLQTGIWLVEDDKVREHIFKICKAAQVANIEIERSNQNRIDIYIHCFQPGIILGKDMNNLKVLKKQINYIVGRKVRVNLNVLPLEKATFSARIIAREIADAIENRVSFRNAQKIAIKKVLASGAKGIQTNVSGRLGGVEMAREEGYSEGIVPKSTLRADIDYALEIAETKYGSIGVKVWINRGEIFRKSEDGPLATYGSLNIRKKGAPTKPGMRSFNPEQERQFREAQTLEGIDQQADGFQKQESPIIMIGLKAAQINTLFDPNANKNAVFCELRPKNYIERVLLCATDFENHVLGEFDLGRIETMHKDAAFKKYEAQSFLTKQEFLEQFQSVNDVHVFIVKTAYKYQNPKPLEAFGMHKEPHHFKYLKVVRNTKGNEG